MIVYLLHLPVKILLRCVICAAGVLLPGISALGQQLVPRPVRLNTVASQGLRFGAFTSGKTGGTIAMSATGNRTASGDVVLLGLGHIYAPALFELETEPGTVIAVLNGPDAILTGSTGGRLSLHIGASNPTLPLVTTAVPPARTLISIGGTLTVGPESSNPAGSYSGYFYITLIRE